MKYNTFIYDGNLYANATRVSLPTESHKYQVVPWQANYSWGWLADTLYGDAKYFWILMQANNITNPYTDMSNKNIKILKYEYLGELNV
jgi:hypothetical protein